MRDSYPIAGKEVRRLTVATLFGWRGFAHGDLAYVAGPLCRCDGASIRDTRGQPTARSSM